MSFHSIKAQFLVLCCITACLLGCGERDILFISSHDISDNGWSENHKLTFDDIPMEDGQVYIRIEHSKSYGYENLYLKAFSIQNRDTLDRDIFSINLMNEQGQWLGTSIDDGLLAVDYRYDGDSRWSGPVTLDLQQYSRAFLLKGIEKISILVKKN